MFQLLKRFWLVLVLILAGAPSVFGFSFLGPKLVDLFQDPSIGYFETPPASAFADLGAGVDLGGPKNLGESYRWNIPVLYWAADETFLDYFGSNGVLEVQKAFAIFNGMSNLSSYSTTLEEFPLNSSRLNYQASALNLLDLKSVTMSAVIEELGLAQPDRWTWCLHDRFTGGATCPNYAYLVIQRNFDPISQLYSSYVNGVLYDYVVNELCTLNPNPYAPLLADAIELVPDPSQLADSFSAVAAYNSINQPGTFYNNLTRDDVGGLRYSMSTNRLHVEAADPGSQMIFTNTSQKLLLSTLDLAVFSQQALTNDPITLAGLYPGLLITQSSNYFSNVITTNITSFLTNAVGSPPGSGNRVVLVTNLSTNVGTFFVNSVGNVVTNHVYTKGYITVTTLTIGPPLGAPPGADPVTTSTTKTIFTNFINGDFFIIPTNALCGNGFDILNVQLVSNVLTTNFVGPLFNTNVNVTNLFTNGAGQTFVIEDITYFTNYTLSVYPIQCIGGTNTVALREGIDKINFIRQDFDSLLGNFWVPVTNFYSLTAVTNGAATPQYFQRVLTAPDFVLSASDQAAGPAGAPAVNAIFRSVPNYNTAQALPNSAGPGTLDVGAGISLIFEKVGPIFVTEGSFFLSGGLALSPSSSFGPNFLFGSFDGSTNAPIVYPDGTSLSGLLSSVFFQITNSAALSASISSNTAAHPFSIQLGAAGGSPPYIWSLTTNSPALPSGFSLSTSGLLSGVPATLGTYDFIVQAKDAGLRTATAELSIQIRP